MIAQKVIQNYAYALFANASFQKKQQECLEQIDLLGQTLFDIDKAMGVLSSPVVPNSSKNNFIKAVAKKFEFEQIVTQFFYVLIKNSRISWLGEIIEAYSYLLAESRGVKTAEVISATKLQKTELSMIKDFLEKELGKIIEIKDSEDESLMGGVQIKYDSIVLDYSVAGALDKITKIARDAKFDL